MNKTTPIEVEVKSRRALRSWFKKHHSRPESIWLVTYKKGSPYFLEYDAIVEEALCFGWIDSLPRSLDAERKMLRLSPRKEKSGWSKKNKARVEKLIEEGLMEAPGFLAVERARADGSWDKLNAVDEHIIPPDLKKALSRNLSAKNFFEKFPPSTKKAILEWINGAKTEETRRKRVEETARLAAKNIRANQYRQPKRK